MIIPARLTKNISLLGNEYFNLYLVQGETFAIVEGGVSGITSPFLDQLDQLGVPPEAISYLIILHSHFDHMMVFPTIKGRYPWVKVVSSGLNRTIFSSDRIVSKLFDSDRKMTRSLMEKGLISEAPDLAPQVPFPLDIPVEEGSMLDLGRGVRLKFIETPGHSPDCLSAYQEEEGVLFCSDAAGFHVPPDFFRPNCWHSLEKADISFKKMKEVAPQILCRGHYGALQGREEIRQHLQMSHMSIQEFGAFVLKKIQEGVPVEGIAEEVTKQFSRGFLELFPPEDNYRLWKLLIRRTLEHFGIEPVERQ